MCGIVAGFSKKQNINEEVLIQFEDQSSRGTNGFGSIFLDEKGKFSIYRATGQIKAILDVKLKPTKALIFHHRMPSSSKNKISQTHPIKISSGDLKHDYYFVHNGVIRNEDERKKVHNDELGYNYSTEVEHDSWYDKKEIMFNDSEVIGYDIARFIEDQTKIIEAAGSVAFIMTQVDKKSQVVKQIFYGRNSGNPLKLAKTRDYIFLSSEGKGDDIKEDTLYSFKLNDYKITKKKMVIPTISYTDAVEEDKKDKEEEKSKGIIVEKESFTDYDDRGWKNLRSAHNYDDEWMNFEEEQEVDKYFNAATMELDNLREIIAEAKGDELYLIDTEDIVKNIAIQVSRGVEYARNLKISEYIADQEDELVIDKTGADLKLPEKTSSK